jgi:hypothetical protein
MLFFEFLKMACVPTVTMEGQCAVCPHGSTPADLLAPPAVGAKRATAAQVEVR